MSINGLCRLARATSVAAVIAAASGAPEITGLPLCSVVDDAALKFGMVQSERERLRRKPMAVLMSMAKFPANCNLGPLVKRASCEFDEPILPANDINVTRWALKS